MNRKGMTLIELLVGMFLASLVTYIAFDLIRDEQGNYTKTRTKVRLQSDARDAIRVIEEDLANVGFRAGLATQTTAAAPTTSFIHASLNSCGTLAEEDRLEIRDDSTTSDTLDARFFNRDASKGVDCQATPIRVRYLVQGTNLIREYWAANTPAAAAPTTSTTILENVVSLQFQAAVDTMLHPASTPLAQQTFNFPVQRAEDSLTGWTFSNLVAGAKTKLTTSGGDSALPLTGWSTSSEGTAAYTSYWPVDPQSTYQVSCMIRINSTFQQAFGAGHLNLDALIGADTVGSTQVSLPTVVGGPTWVSWVIHTGLVGGPLRIQVRGQIGNVLTLPPLPPTLDFGSIGVRRLAGYSDANRTTRMLWSNTSKTPEFRRQINGIRVWLVAKSPRGNRETNQQSFDQVGNWDQNTKTPIDHNSYAVYERIIPVVHYGY